MTMVSSRSTSLVASQPLRYRQLERAKIGDRLEEVVELFGLGAVVLGSDRKIEEPLLEARVGEPGVGPAPRALREREQTLGRHLDLVEERRALHRLEQPARGEDGVGLRPAELDLARQLARAHPPARARRRRAWAPARARAPATPLSGSGASSAA